MGKRVKRPGRLRPCSCPGLARRNGGAVPWRALETRGDSRGHHEVKEPFGRIRQAWRDFDAPVSFLRLRDGVVQGVSARTVDELQLREVHLDVRLCRPERPQPTAKRQGGRDVQLAGDRKTRPAVSRRLLNLESRSARHCTFRPATPPAPETVAVPQRSHGSEF